MVKVFKALTACNMFGFFWVYAMFGMLGTRRGRMTSTDSTSPLKRAIGGGPSILGNMLDIEVE